MTEQKVTVDRSDLIEALALIDAAGTISSALNGRVDTPLSEFFSNRAWELKDRMLGRAPDEEEAWLRDPDTVEIDARNNELTADALESVGLSAAYRRHARDIRHSGTIEVKFPNVQEELVA